VLGLDFRKLSSIPSAHGSISASARWLTRQMTMKIQ
jgi:hypothetical protein